jgi:hypothetical protein
MNEYLELKSVFQSSLNRTRSTSFLEYKKKWVEDNFAQCRECNKLKSLWASLARRSHMEDLWDLKLKEHNSAQGARQELYYANRNLYTGELEKVLIIIHN